MVAGAECEGVHVVTEVGEADVQIEREDLGASAVAIGHDLEDPHGRREQIQAG